MLTGYNICRFDTEYVATRARRFLRADEQRVFWKFGPYLCQDVEEKPFKLESAAYGQNEGVNFDFKGGTAVLDAMQYIAMNYKLPMFSLGYVSKHFLGDTKEDLDIGTMWKLVERGQLSRVIDYVLKDGRLVRDLVQNRDMLNSIFEMSRATSTLPNDILTRGQQIRVMNLLRRICAARGVLLDVPKDRQTAAEAAKRKYIGARVVNPKAGFYDPKKGYVVTLDFASLYPSIVRAYNLCYQTWIPASKVDEVRARCPDLEIVACELRLGQVWGKAGKAADMKRALHSPKLADLIAKQVKAGQTNVSLTHDEFDAVVPEALTEAHCIAVVVEEGAKPVLYSPIPVAHYFAKGVTGADGVEQRCPSLLPSILAELAVLRKKAKKAGRRRGARAGGDGARRGERGRGGRGGAGGGARARGSGAVQQRAASMKVVMNSGRPRRPIRGGWRSANDHLPPPDGAADSIKIVNETRAEMGFPASDVVYGDTDSIFVHVAGASKAEALDVGSVVSARCNAHFERATKSKNLVLEFEALFDGLILIGKKCYAGSQYAVVETGERATRTYNGAEYALDVCALGPKPKQYKKGMRAVRRDTPPFVARAQGDSIDLLLKTQDVPQVLAYIQKQVDDLLAFRVPRADFQLTMQLKREDSYKKAPEDDVAKQPHLRLVKKLERRSKEGKLPQACTLWGVGERVPYFYAETDELLACDRAECPAYGEAHNVPYDRAHYFRLLDGALAQGLGVVPEVKAYIDAEKATRRARHRPCAGAAAQGRRDAAQPAGRAAEHLGAATTGGNKRERLPRPPDRRLRASAPVREHLQVSA